MNPPAGGPVVLRTRTDGVPISVSGDGQLVTEGGGCPVTRCPDCGADFCDVHGSCRNQACARWGP